MAPCWLPQWVAQALHQVRDLACVRCQRPTETSQWFHCFRCLRRYLDDGTAPTLIASPGHFPLHTLAACAWSPEVKAALYGWKFYQRSHLAPLLADWATYGWNALLQEHGLVQQAVEGLAKGSQVCLVPIPPRQTNHLHGWAHRFAAANQLVYRPQVLTWQRTTQTQHRLSSRQARAANVLQALHQQQAVGSSVQTVVLLDDLMTTGATLTEAARAIRVASPHVRTIIGLTLTRTPLSLHWCGPGTMTGQSTGRRLAFGSSSLAAAAGGVPSVGSLQEPSF